MFDFVQPFRRKSPAAAVLLFFVGILLKLPIFMALPAPLRSAGDGPLYRMISQPFTRLGWSFLQAPFAYLLLFAGALMISHALNEWRMMPKPNFLPGLAYLTITSLFPEWNALSPLLISTTLIILATVRLFGIYAKSKAAPRIFEVGVWMGLAALTWFPAVGYLPLLAIGMAALRPWRASEWGAMLAGALFPFYLTASYLYLTDAFSLATLFPGWVMPHFPGSLRSGWIAVRLAVIGIPLLLGIQMLNRHSSKMLIQGRKNWSLLLMQFLPALVIPFLATAPVNSAFLLGIPVAATLHAIVHYYLPRWMSTAVWILTALFVIVQQWIGGQWAGYL